MNRLGVVEQGRLKINAYYKIMKVFLFLCQPVVGDSQNQNMNLSLPIINRDTLTAVTLYMNWL